MAAKRVKIAYYHEDREVEIPEENLIGVLHPKEIHRAENLAACLNENLWAPAPSTRCAQERKRSASSSVT